MHVIQTLKKDDKQQLKKYELAMFNDLPIQCFSEISRSQFHFQSLLLKTISQHVVLSEDMFEDYRWDKLQHIVYFITPVHQSRNFKGCKSVYPINNHHRITKNQMNGQTHQTTHSKNNPKRQKFCSCIRTATTVQRETIKTYDIL